MIIPRTQTLDLGALLDHLCSCAQPVVDAQLAETLATSASDLVRSISQRAASTCESVADAMEDEPDVMASLHGRQSLRLMSDVFSLLSGLVLVANEMGHAAGHGDKAAKGGRA